jgi:hypothetical protein
MNAINYALNHVKHVIPEEILKEAFKSAPRSFASAFDSPSTAFDFVEHNIRHKVINDRVNVDCGLKGALEIAVDLNKCKRMDHDVYTRTYEIPAELLGGRRIISVKSVHYTNIAHSWFPTNSRSSGNMLLNAAIEMYRSVASLPIVNTCHVEPIGPTTIVMQDTAVINATQLYVVINISHDENMNTLKPTIFPLYAEMVEYAVKAYIYNHLIIKLGDDKIKGGFNLGVFKQVVEGYADANELYQTLFKEKWGKSQFSNDRNRMKKWIGLTMNRG